MTEASEPVADFATSEDFRVVQFTPLEVVVIPVSDVDRAKAFSESLSWRLDVAHLRRAFARPPYSCIGGCHATDAVLVPSAHPLRVVAPAQAVTDTGSTG